MKKKHLITLLQIAVTLSILFFIFRDPVQRKQMLAAVRAADPRWLLAALAVTGVSPICGTIRWGILMRAQGIKLPWKRITQIYFIGNFFNMIMPGALGGDVVKIYYLLKEVGEQKAKALLTVVMDRVVGMITLFTIAVIFTLSRYKWLTQTPVSSGVTATVILIMGAAVGGMVVAALIAKLGLAEKLPHNLPGRTKMIEMSSAFLLYAHHWKATLAAVGLSIPGHFCLFVSFWFSALALRIHIPFLDIVALLPIVNTIVSIPISVSGVGVREALSRKLLHALCGVSESDAVVMAEIAFLCIVFYYLVGGVVYLFYRSSHGTPPSEEVMEKLEEATADKIAHQNPEISPAVSH